MCHRQPWTWERRCQTGAGRRRRRRTPSKTSRLQPGDPHHGGRWRPSDIANRDLGDVAVRGPGVGHTPSKTSRLQPAPLIGQARLCWRVYSHWNLSSFHIRNSVICHLTSQVGGLWYHGPYHGQYHGHDHAWYHRPMISEVTDIIDSELWYHSFISMISYMTWSMILAMIS